MTIQFLSREEQPKELLAYLGVSKSSVGWRYLLSCFIEIASGCAPGVEVYEHVALIHGRTAAQVVRCSQRALLKAQQKKPQEWEETFPKLEMDVSRTGLTLFLRRATAWLRHNRIGYFYLGRVKHRIPASDREENSCWYGGNT